MCSSCACCCYWCWFDIEVADKEERLEIIQECMSALLATPAKQGMSLVSNLLDLVSIGIKLLTFCATFITITRLCCLYVCHIIFYLNKQLQFWPNAVFFRLFRENQQPVRLTALPVWVYLFPFDIWGGRCLIIDINVHWFSGFPLSSWVILLRFNVLWLSS